MLCLHLLEVAVLALLPARQALELLNRFPDEHEGFHPVGNIGKPYRPLIVEVRVKRMDCGIVTGAFAVLFPAPSLGAVVSLVKALRVV